jgi:hypothetical protein
MLTIIMSLAVLQAASAEAAPPAPPRCDSDAHAAFDFWVGEWDVYPKGSDDLVARSQIERLYNGCAIRENWMPLNGRDGGSLNSLDPETGLWHQTWIGSSPGRVEFTGGQVDAKMVLTGWWPGAGGPGVDGLVRMTYSREQGGAVRQRGELSTDHGLTWQPSFDFVYRPRGAAAG